MTVASPRDERARAHADRAASVILVGLAVAAAGLALAALDLIGPRWWALVIVIGTGVALFGWVHRRRALARTRRRRGG